MDNSRRSGGVKRQCPKSDKDDKFKKIRCGINIDGAITLIIWFAPRPYRAPRAKRQIRCKLSDYPFDILKRVHTIFISPISFEEFEKFRLD